MGLSFPLFKEDRGVVFRLSVTLGPALLLVLLAVLLPDNIATPLNTIAWIVSNVLLAYSAGALVLFLAAYFYFFDPRATTGGRLIFQFMLSLVGVISLNIIGIFINPTFNTAWYAYPDGVDPWRPVVRLIVYGFVAYAVTSLAVLLVLRKWFPEKVKKASDIKLKVRTSENPTITEGSRPLFDKKPYSVFSNDTASTDLIEETWPNQRGKK